MIPEAEALLRELLDPQPDGDTMMPSLASEIQNALEMVPGDAMDRFATWRQSAMESLK